MRRTRAAVARPLHDVAEGDAGLRLAGPPARHQTTTSLHRIHVRGTEALLGLGFGGVEFPGGGGWEVVPDAEGGGAVVDDDGGGAREAGEVGLPVGAVPRRHADRRRWARRRRRG